MMTAQAVRIESRYWSDYAACRNHPMLDRDAWNMVESGYPVGDGAKAVVVCRKACPVRKECRASFTRGVECVAGGGWFDVKGRFVGADLDAYDSILAGAYLGVDPSKVRSWMHKDLPVKYIFKGRAWFDVNHLDRLVYIRRRGAAHGTYAAKVAHQIRGEDPCRMCQGAWAPSEDVLAAALPQEGVSV